MFIYSNETRRYLNYNKKKLNARKIKHTKIKEDLF